MSKISWSQALADYLGDETASYAYIAQKYGVSKRSVTKRAVKEGWQELKQKTSLKVHQQLPEIVSEPIAEVNARDAKVGKYFQAKAIEAIQKQNLRPQNIKDAIALFVAGFNVERKALGLDSENKNIDAYVPGRKMYIVLPQQEERVGV